MIRKSIELIILFILLFFVPQIVLAKQNSHSGINSSIKEPKLPAVTIESPSSGWTVGKMMLIKGRISDESIKLVQVSINGDRYLMKTTEGSFSRSFPAARGKNVIKISATNEKGTSTSEITSYNEIPSIPLRVVLTSDSDGVYTDLHIYEPSKKMSNNIESVKNNNNASTVDVKSMPHVYWANTESPSGGTFYLNEQPGSFDDPGYGPYLYVHRAPPKGLFFIVANYWAGTDNAHTLATLNITLFEGSDNEIKKKVTIPLARPNATVLLAAISFLDSKEAYIYIPTQDILPKNATWPSNMEEIIKNFERNGLVVE